jgi:Spy/CpxP family protein refolding chaperone
MLRSLVRGVALAVVAGSMLTASALAQPGGGGGDRGRGGPGGGMMMMGGGMGGGMMGGFDPPVTSAQLNKYATQLKFTDDQKEAAKALFDGYFAAFQSKADAARKKMDDVREQFRETRDPSVWTSVGESMQEFRKQRTQAEKAFMADLKSLLTPEQESTWPKIERERRRDTTMRMGFMSGERMDVVAMVDRMKLSPEQMAIVTPILDAYEQELDPALAKRNDLMENAMGQGMQMFRRMMDNGGAPDDEMTKMFEEGRKNAMRVRDINRRYASQVEAALPADVASKFRDEVNRESYPAVYRQRYANTALAAAEAFADLTDAQRQSIQSLREGYQRDLAQLQDKGKKAQDEQEANFSLQNMMAFRGNDAMRELRTQGEALDTRTLDTLKNILTPEQAAKLPERNQGGRRGEDRVEIMGGLGGDSAPADNQRRRAPRRGGGGEGGNNGNGGGNQPR